MNITANQLVRPVSIDKARWEKTVQPVWWYHGYLPIGTEYKSFETRNFGAVVLREPHFGRRLYTI